MNELTNRIKQVMTPKAALIAYEYKEGYYSKERSYLEIRPINKEGCMGAGVPVTYEFMNSLMESYTGEMTGIPYGRMPSNMLWCDPRRGHEKYIWYNPPQKREMYFRENLGIPDGIFSVPGVIYIVSGDSLDIFSYKGKRPKEKTELYLAPFFNVKGSSVCLGSSTLKKPQEIDFKELQAYWEKRFWLSEFSHLGGTRNPTLSNLVAVTENARNHPFNYEELESTGKHLKDILS